MNGVVKQPYKFCTLISATKRGGDEEEKITLLQNVKVVHAVWQSEGAPSGG